MFIEPGRCNAPNRGQSDAYWVVEAVPFTEPGRLDRSVALKGGQKISVSYDRGMWCHRRDLPGVPPRTPLSLAPAAGFSRFWVLRQMRVMCDVLSLLPHVCALDTASGDSAEPQRGIQEWARRDVLDDEQGVQHQAERRTGSQRHGDVHHYRR